MFSSFEYFLQVLVFCLVSLPRTILSEHCMDESRTGGAPYRSAATDDLQLARSDRCVRDATRGRRKTRLPFETNGQAWALSPATRGRYNRPDFSRDTSGGILQPDRIFLLV